ncbi:hypothetical protein N7494_006944 [Penicillium frequentans]|uniref:FAD dependent oxidoreductase domain-containing protein n=1 Tax=Penicillium frequentans TaxID=3151616 RepID=A0AAD6CS98_9EURO|nr:hypothetical protein N7494_006944 [Penicillium glabrum]
MVLPINNPTKSFWIEEANSTLRDFRSTKDLPKETDVTIIGSGYTGAATAYWLNKARWDNLQTLINALNETFTWSARFGPEGAMKLIKHEMAHLSAFESLLAEEGIAEEVCFRLDETFDAAMSDEAWVRLKGAYEAMKRDHGENNEVVRLCRLIEDTKAAEEFTQMKACVGAVVHPAGQVWPYKFVHALLRIVLKTGNLNLQAHTPVESVSERDDSGWIIVKTARGDVRTKTVVHATNRWASHLLPEFGNLIFGSRATLASIKAPEGFIKHTGAQHWDSVVNNYHLQLPPPYNSIIIGGARALLVHTPHDCAPNDEEDKQFKGASEFFQSWVESTSIDAFPFVGGIPNRDGQFVAAGFSGHGMPRILLSTAHITPLVLDALKAKYTPPSLVAPYPPLPMPFLATAERIASLQEADSTALFERMVKDCQESAKKSFCDKFGVARGRKTDAAPGQED